MAKNKKKAAAKKKNIKKNKQQAALTAKEAVAQKKAALGKVTEEEKSKAAKDKAAAKALKEKEKRERARAKKQAKIDKKKELDQKAKKTEKAAQEERRRLELEERQKIREAQELKEQKEREKEEAKQAKVRAKKEKRAGKKKKAVSQKAENKIEEKQEAETKIQPVSAEVDYREEKEEILQTDEDLVTEEEALRDEPEESAEEYEESIIRQEESSAEYEENTKELEESGDEQEELLEEVLPEQITQESLEEELNMIARKLSEELVRLTEESKETQTPQSDESEIEEILQYVKGFESHKESPEIIKEKPEDSSDFENYGEGIAEPVDTLEYEQVVAFEPYEELPLADETEDFESVEIIEPKPYAEDTDEPVEVVDYDFSDEVQEEGENETPQDAEEVEVYEEAFAPDFSEEPEGQDEVFPLQVGGIADLVSRAIHKDAVFVPAQKFESPEDPPAAEAKEGDEDEAQTVFEDRKENEEPAPTDSGEEAFDLKGDIWGNPLAQLVFSAVSKEEETEEKTTDIAEELDSADEDEEHSHTELLSAFEDEYEGLQLIDAEYDGEDDYDQPQPVVGVVDPLPEEVKREKKVQKSDKKKQKKEAKENKKEKPIKKAKEKAPKDEAPSLKMGVALIINKFTSSARERVQKIPKGVRLAFKALIALALVGALVFAGVYLFSYKVPKAAIPKYRGVTETLINVNEIEADLQEQVKKAKATPSKGDKSFSFFASPNLSVEEWYSPLPVILGNVETNNCDFLVTVLTKDNKVLYRSAGVKPGYYLPTIKLNNLAMNLGYGEHELILVVAAYNPQTYENVGVRYLKLNLEIGNEYGQAQEQETQVE